MKITHSGYKNGAATLMAVMLALALTGCAKSTVPSQTVPANKEVDDLFANLGDPKTPAPGKEKEQYFAQLLAVIQSHLKDAEAYSGRSCTLRIKLAPDGLLISVRAEQGEPQLCQAAIKAIVNARLPKPPTAAVYEAVNNGTLEFRPI
ncbi:cell envelope integrity protein TolA [Serratia marcescens]|uniref:cell envelope integrity protein TolA n=1 Tax=Serratia TaxID=613 RepID=UPI000669852C|nr:MULTISPECIES: cell envelope integrity protein TolA [Serratia]AVE48801.1 protein TolA [Serratia marcescens]MBH2853104.1 cell envelope integrity protein TolA [Serratia marcescens]MBH2972169.1 cell envelope integrity protein TolA [Serratia marcescens]MBH2978217.1 cell envelope integrity protein TolA [Serratia marcescens]MBN3985295.1 cell envelope integrity protein TolA [Serratia marcescens]